MIIEVIPESKTFNETNTFSYLVPTEVEDQVFIGSIVRIPFGKRTIRGVVSKIATDDKTVEKPQKFELKEIVSIDNSFVLPEDYITTARWISEFYLCSLGEAIAIFLPPSLKRPRKNLVEKDDPTLRSDNIALDPGQKKVLESIIEKYHAKKKQPILIKGVTGSGKTEIYIKLAKEVLKQKRQIIILVPEIFLTPQIVERFQAVFGNNIALMHSGLSTSEKLQCYDDFFHNKKAIIIGPRSALLVPSKNLGAIIIDEEQEDAYKQEQNPRYHAVTLAQKIAESSNALLVLGSATPRVETFHKAQNGEFLGLEISSRYGDFTMPKATVIDLKNELRTGNFSVISEKMKEMLDQTLANNRQAILFLNRRGLATFVSCRDCGEVLLCPRCHVSLVYHVGAKDNFLNCHHCDYRTPLPKSCPKCQSLRIKFFGTGIDKVEQEIKKIYPKARVEKIDSTTMKSKHDYRKFYERLKTKEIDIVIGTQIIAKGLDIEGVDFVGVISADTGLHLPQYRASEKIFQILTQVSGRSGRKSSNGRTIIQTYWPDNPAIALAANHDYISFYHQEIINRKELDYPPFSRIIRVISENFSAEKARSDIFRLSDTLKQKNIQHLGPGKCFFEKLHKKFRYHLIIKEANLPNKKISEIYRDNSHLIWDIEPTNLL